MRNTSHLAGFAKARDLPYFLQNIGNIGCVRALQLAPTADLLDGFKQGTVTWEEYEKRFNNILEQRKPEETFPKQLLEDGCLLCSEDKPDNCHRRLVAEYFRDKLTNIEIEHL